MQWLCRTSQWGQVNEIRGMLKSQDNPVYNPHNILKGLTGLILWLREGRSRNIQAVINQPLFVLPCVTRDPQRLELYLYGCIFFQNVFFIWKLKMRSKLSPNFKCSYLRNCFESHKVYHKCNEMCFVLSISIINSLLMLFSRDLFPLYFSLCFVLYICRISGK